jgi:hypothetical protein
VNEKFTAVQLLALLKQRAEDSAYEKSKKLGRRWFSKIWLEDNWTRWFWSGAMHGVTIYIDLNNLKKENPGEYQCLQHHFCLEKERIESEVYNLSRSA